MNNAPDQRAGPEKEREKALQMLSLCRRAGKVRLGFDLVKSSVMKGEARLVLCSLEASEKTRKEVRRFCGQWDAPLRLVPYSLEELGRYLGKRVGVVAVAEGNFAKAVLEKLPPEEPREEGLS